MVEMMSTIGHNSLEAGNGRDDRGEDVRHSAEQGQFTAPAVHHSAQVDWCTVGTQPACLVEVEGQGGREDSRQVTGGDGVVLNDGGELN